jgi:hypothetical protein
MIDILPRIAKIISPSTGCGGYRGFGRCHDREMLARVRS